LFQDNTIIATAIPTITDEFNSIDDIGWYGSSYFFTTCSLMLVFGKLYTFYSIKWVYLIAIAVFEVGSVVCGATPNSVGLILGRAIAGLGGAGIYSGSMLIIAQTMPLERRPICTGLLGGLYGVAGVAGPLMGGAFTDYVTWRWCFYINIPFGAVTALFLLCFFKAPKPIKKSSNIREQLAQLDLLGLLFFIPAIVSILLALQWGGTKYSWGNGRIIGLFVTFGVLILIFIAIQWKKQETATVNPRLVKNRNVSGAAFYCLCLTGSFIVFTYYVSESPSSLPFLCTQKQVKEYWADSTHFSSLYGSKVSRMYPPQSPV
jgi:MFS family permease